MEKVVILARVSTDKQEYQRQIAELIKNEWQVVVNSISRSAVGKVSRWVDHQLIESPMMSTENNTREKSH